MNVIESSLGKSDSTMQPAPDMGLLNIPQPELTNKSNNRINEIYADNNPGSNCSLSGRETDHFEKLVRRVSTDLKKNVFFTHI